MLPQSRACLMNPNDWHALKTNCACAPAQDSRVLGTASWHGRTRLKIPTFAGASVPPQNMSTDSSIARFVEPALQEATAIIKTCSHFGFCTATCPTYQFTHDENESPRGRIDLIRAMLEKGGPPETATVRHLDSCLSCLACMSTCAVKVDYMHLIDHAKAHVERHFRRSLKERLMRAFIARIVPNRRVFGIAMRLGRGAKMLAHALPSRIADLVDLVPRASPVDLQDVSPGTYEAVGTRRWRVALLAGCAQRVLAPQINAATVRLLTRHGCEVVVAQGVECCGALTLHMGRRADGCRSAKRNIDAWTRGAMSNGLDAIIVNASGCGTAMKDYGHLFEHDPVYRDRSRQIAALTVDVSEFIARIGLVAPSGMNFRVAYHDACSLRNAQRVTREPRGLLRSAGYSVVDVPETHFCCGSAGTYNLLQPRVAKQLGERKARHAESTGAAMLAVGNIGCVMQISRYTDLPVLHTVELLDWATGGPIPPGLRGKPLAEF
jgi:glycolate oxidase iron-sulfur subunit